MFCTKPAAPPANLMDQLPGRLLAGVQFEKWICIWIAASIVVHIGATALTHDSSPTPAHLLIDAILGSVMTAIIWLIWFVVIAVLEVTDTIKLGSRRR